MQRLGESDADRLKHLLWKGELQELLECLKTTSTSVNATFLDQSRLYTPLIFACEFGNLSTVKFLLSQKADVNQCVPAKLHASPPESLVEDNRRDSNSALSTVLQLAFNKKNVVDFLRLFKLHDCAVTHTCVDVALETLKSRTPSSFLAFRVLMDELGGDLAYLLSSLISKNFLKTFELVLNVGLAKLQTCVETDLDPKLAFRALGMIPSTHLRARYAYSFACRCNQVGMVLCLAIDAGEVELLETVATQMKGKFDLPMEDGYTPLSLCCIRQNLESVRCLLSKRVDPNVELSCKKNPHGFPSTALHLAIMHSNRTNLGSQNTLSIVNCLIQHGAAPTGGLRLAYSTRDFRVFQFLLEHCYHETGALYYELGILMDYVHSQLVSKQLQSLADDLRSRMMMDFERSHKNSKRQLNVSNYKSWLARLTMQERDLVLTLCCTDASKRSRVSGTCLENVIHVFEPNLQTLLDQKRLKMLQHLLKLDTPPDGWSVKHGPLSYNLALAIETHQNDGMELLLRKKADPHITCGIGILEDQTPLMVALHANNKEAVGMLSKRDGCLDQALVGVLQSSAFNLKEKQTHLTTLFEHGASPTLPFKQLEARADVESLIELYMALPFRLWKGGSLLHVLSEIDSHAEVVDAHVRRSALIHECAKSACANVVSAIKQERMAIQMEQDRLRKQWQQLSACANRWKSMAYRQTLTLCDVIKEMRLAKVALVEMRETQQRKKKELQRKSEIQAKKAHEQRLLMVRKINQLKYIQVQNAIRERNKLPDTHSKPQREPRPRRLTLQTLTRISKPTEEDADSDGAESVADSVCTVDIQLPEPAPHYTERINERFGEAALADDPEKVVYAQQHCLKYGRRTETFGGRILHRDASGFTMVTNKELTVSITAYKGAPSSIRSRPQKRIGRLAHHEA